MRCGARLGGGVRAPRPTEGNGKLGKRVVGDADPYEELQGVRWGGRPQGSPLRRGARSVVGGPM